MLLRTVIFLWVGLLSLLASNGEARTYRQYLDARRAEETLSSLILKPRLATQTWLEIIKEKKGLSYKVHRGETLWDISARQLGSPFLWRKLWQVNAFLANPHELEIGTELKWLGSDRDLASTDEWTIPVVKLLPATAGAEDIEQDAFLSRQIIDRSRLFFFVIDEGAVLGHIAGSMSDYKAFTSLDTVFLRLNEMGKVKVGDKFSIVKRSGKLIGRDESDQKVLGETVRFLGEVRVIDIGEKFAKAEFTSMFNPVSRGDELIQTPQQPPTGQHNEPPDTLRAKIIMGEDETRRWFRQGETVVLNRGSEDGMQPGHLFRVYRDSDPVLKSKKDVDYDFKGEVRVLHTSRFASIGYIVRNTELLQVNDDLLPSQAFTEPQGIPSRENRTIEIP